jgi:hypothetical protein
VAEQRRSTLKAEVRFLSSAPFPVKECLAPHEALGGLAGAVNITTILLVILGLVLVTTIVLSANSACLSPHSGRPSLEVGGAGRWLVAAAS